MRADTHLLGTFIIVAAALFAPGGMEAHGTVGSVLPAIFTSSITAHKLAALTFDDGPSPYSVQVLAVLRRYHVPATFFLVGYRVLGYRDEVRESAREGNLLGNHTYTHADLQFLSDADAMDQINRTQVQIRSASGVTSNWFRPPYGAVDQRVVRLAASAGLHTVTWSVDPRDWSMPGTTTIVDRVLYAIHPGSVVLFHDGGGNRSETVAALSILLPALLAQGYRFITLDEMFFPRRHETTPHKVSTGTEVRQPPKTSTPTPVH